jgi:hypothetical protein
MRFHIFVLVFLLAYNLNTNAQFLSGDNTQILVKGIIVDENTKEPLGVSIEMRSEDGKKIKTQSNSETGLFEQLLPSGVNYTVILNSDDILRKDFEFSTDVAKEYKEQQTEWTVVKPRKGSKVFSGNIFNAGQSEISTEGLKMLKELQMLLRFNRSLYVAFEIKGDSGLAEKRLSEIRSHIENWTREKSRIELKPIENQSGDNDLFVRITKIEEFLSK